MAVEINLTINGAASVASVGEDEVLLDTLRDRVGLKGSRFGCGEEACGACTVLIGGVPTCSCTYRTVDANSADIVTVEGLDPDGPLISAFIAEQAGQCGYCLTGILMSATALLSKGQPVGRAEIIEALDRHLCRCGAHGRIVRAIERAAARSGGNT
jgi:nicotinate dehydrogenase subunit A